VISRVPYIWAMGRTHSLIGALAVCLGQLPTSLLAVDPSVVTDDVPLLDFYGEPYRDVFENILPIRACATDEQRPELWAWPFSRVRLRMTPDHAVENDGWRHILTGMIGAGPKIRRTSEVRGFCARNISIPWLCEDCRQTPCVQSAGRVHDSLDYAGYLPPQGGCIFIDRLPVSSAKVQLSWDQDFDPWVFARLLAGVTLVWGWRVLRESRVVHALLGSFSSLAIIAVLLLWSITRMMSSNTSMTLGRSISALMMMSFTFIPAAREAFTSWVVPSSPTDWMAWLNMHDPVWGMPIGWIGAGISIAVTVSIMYTGATYSMEAFASAPDPEGNVSFGIGSDGRRVDMLPVAPMRQRSLGFVIWSLGILMLLQSTHSDAVSLVVALLALSKNHVHHAVSIRIMALSATLRPEDLRPLVNSKTYEDQGRFHTVAALAQLQSYLRENPSVVNAVREEHELRLRRFSNGAHHCPPSHDADCERRGWNCIVL